MADAVGELADGVVGVVREGLGGGATGPAAFVLESLGEIPVKEGAEGLDVGGEQGVDEAFVEVDAFGVRRAGALRENARPCDGEAEAFGAEALHQLDVLLVAVVEVVGDVAGLALEGFAGGVGEGIPDGGAAAVLVDSAFDLIGGGGGAPDEVVGEAVGRSGEGGQVLRCGGIEEGLEGGRSGESGSGLQEGAAFHGSLVGQGTGRRAQIQKARSAGNITVAANAPFITSSVINSVSNSAFQNSSPIFVTAGGSANVITASPTPAYGTLQSGTIIWIKASATNTGATSLNVSGLGAIAVQKQISTGLVALIGGEIITGTNYLLSYNGSVWEIINPSQPPFLCSVFYSSGSGTALTANAAAVKIPFDTARSGLDPNSMFDSVNQWIVAPITGFFNINVTLINSGYTGTAGSTGWPVYIYINSSLSFEICLNANGGDQTGASGSRSIKLNAGDKVEVYAAQGGTAPTDNSTVIGDAGGQFTTFDVGYIRS